MTEQAEAREFSPLLPYQSLTPEQRETLRAWFDTHGVNHRDVPINPRMRLEGDVLHVEIFDNRDGKKYLDEGGKIVKRWVSFTPTSLLPWPREEPSSLFDTGISHLTGEQIP